MRKTAEASAQNFKACMPQMTADMHCDTLTLHTAFQGHIKLSELTAEKFQCFAAFSKDDSAAAYAAAKTLFYGSFSSGKFAPVSSYSKLVAAQKAGKTACALTCENIGFTGGNYEYICSLKADGVIMASLVWNVENALAYPNVRTNGLRESLGLKECGRHAIDALDKNKIIVDISHLSDGGAEEILKNRKTPLVASHSCCNGVHADPRNLTDRQLKLIADCGGAVGVNFYKKFLGGEGSFKEICAHIKNIIDIAGEDTPAFGSDWDGVPEDGISVCPCDMRELLQFLADEGINGRVLDKIAGKNFLRVFKEVCG